VGPQLRIVHIAADPCHLRLRGEIDIYTAPALRDALRAAAEAVASRPDATVTVDLSAVSFIDGRGVSTLVAAEAYACVRGVTMQFSGRSARLTRILRITGLDLNDLDADPTSTS
jgi:anti-sigma B factor antagonist